MVHNRSARLCSVFRMNLPPAQPPTPTSQPTRVRSATTAPWLLGLAGLTYGILSSSWDEEVEGSLLGFDELRLNLGRIGDGLKRSGDSAEVRCSVPSPNWSNRLLRPLSQLD